MSDIYAIWHAAQIAEGETMQDGLLRVANLMPDIPQPAAVPHPSPELTWLFTHCRAIGMIERSDSGKWEHDIALFTTRTQDELKQLREALADAIVCVQDWSAYVAPYYLERHDLNGDVKRLRAALEATK